VTRRGPQRAAARLPDRLLLPLGLLIATFGAGVAAGFVYAHEPAPTEVRAVLEVPPATPTTEVRGTLSSAGSDFLEITTSGGAVRLVSPGVPVEDLVPLVGEVPAGVAANLGGNVTENGYVLTGVVLVGPAQ
jgi:hypothetical protein